MKRNNKGQFVKGNKSVSYWKGKKRGKITEEQRKKVSKSMLGVRKSISHRKNISRSKVGKLNPMYKKGYTIDSRGYKLVLIPRHPDANFNGRVLEHRLVMEKKLGRRLSKEDIIHHIDFNPRNNKVSNLYLMTRATHIKLHKSFEDLITFLFNKKIIYFNRKKGNYETR